LSEGIDFADSHCRSVVIVGIPFPPLYDPRIMLKKEHLTEQFNQMRLEQSKAASTTNKENTAKMKAENGGKTTGKTTTTAQSADDWYKIEGTRAVNQALGRIIRHKDVSFHC
jgi:Rad3-related DNA helicase